MGLNSEHRKRDLEIPVIRQKLMKAIEEDFLSDKNVLCLFYGGSIGNGNTDLYSDIDLRVVVKDDVFELYRQNKKERAAKWGSTLFYEDFPWASHSVAHFRGFIKVDSFYYIQHDIQPSVWLKNIEIVHDTDGFMKEIQLMSNQLKYEPSIEEFDLWRSKILANTHEVYRGVMRGEFFYALDCLDSLRLLMTSGWFMEAGIQPNNPGYWAKLEGGRSRLKDWQVSMLQSWMSSREPNEIIDTMKKMVPEFLRLHKELCRKFRIEDDQQQLDEIFNMVL
ncbi:aminoglycoside 6-adenylyltransferase [Bacillus sp. AK031]